MNFYALGRHGAHAEKFLTGFNGTLQIDGHTGYNQPTKPSRKGGDPITVSYCWAVIASLIETCKINGVEPCAYLKSRLEAIAAGHPKNRIDDLLPLNFKSSS